MSRFNHQPTSEYTDMKRAIEEYAEADPESGESVVHVVADALEEHLRESFRERFDVDETTDGADCIGRLIAGTHACPHGPHQKGNDSDHPPHHPPHADHANLWLRDGSAAVFDMHLYDTNGHVLRDVVDFADQWEVEIKISSQSWYYFGATTHIIFHSPTGRENSDQSHSE